MVPVFVSNVFWKQSAGICLCWGRGWALVKGVRRVHNPLSWGEVGGIPPLQHQDFSGQEKALLQASRGPAALLVTRGPQASGWRDQLRNWKPAVLGFSKKFWAYRYLCLINPILKNQKMYYKIWNTGPQSRGWSWSGGGVCATSNTSHTVCISYCLSDLEAFCRSAALNVFT